MPKTPSLLSRCCSAQVRLASWLVIVSALGCALPERSPAPVIDAEHYQSEREQALADLIRDHGEVELRTQAQLGIVAALRWKSPLKLHIKHGDSVSSTVRDFALRYRAILGLSAKLTDDSLDSKSLEVDALGRRHLRLVQSRDKLPIWGSQLLVHLSPLDNSDGTLLQLDSIQGHLYSLPLLSSPDSKPDLSLEDARQQALMATRRQAANAIVSAREPTLYYLPADGLLNLVYRVEVVGQDDQLPLHRALFLDANTGELVRSEELVDRVDVAVPALGSGSGALGATYQLFISQKGSGFLLDDPLRGDQRTTSVSGQQKLPGKTIGSDDPDSWDTDGPGAGVAVDIHAHLATLWDHFATKYGRYGWDGASHGAIAVAHFGRQANLALFDGQQLLFGDGDGKDFAPLGAAFDIVAHEYVHALSRATAEFAAEGESGALSEGYADLLAALTALSVDPSGASWSLGKEVYHPGGKPTALAELSDPHSSGQAALISELLVAGESMTPSSVARHNAGIVGHMGYLLAQKIGIDPCAAIVYRSLTYYLFRYAGFADAADAMAAAARDLYDEPTVAAVRRSWTAVGL